jgi:hypothetical protein
MASFTAFTALAPLALAVLFACAASGRAMAQSAAPSASEASAPQDLAPLVPIRATWRLTNETYKLPAGERMGMVGANLMLDVADQWRLGIASYGAVRGQRGGFITLGAAGEWRPQISPNWSGHVGLFVGAGGGRGGASLAGGGLMLRSDVGLSYALGNWGQVGLGLSHVSFPSGVISSTQPYLLLEHPFNTVLASGWRLPSLGGAGKGLSLPASGQEFAVVVRDYRIASSAVQDNGQPQYGRMQLLGFEWQNDISERWFLKLEAEGAMGGRSDGYMQILAGGGYRQPLWQGSVLKLHGSVGAAGGGRVDTGGGVLLDAGVAWQQYLSRSTALEFGVSQVAAPSHSFKARSLALKLTHRFGVPAVGASAGAQALLPDALAGFDAEHLRVRLTNQTYLKAADGWRREFEDQSVSNLGVQLDYFVTPHWYLTGQGLAAYEGKAGAYMTGQIGAGVRQSLGGAWFAEGEALLGAAGGGGLSVGGGVVGQANVSLGYQISPALSVLATAGHLVAPRGDLRAHVLGLSLAYQFTGFASR